MVTATQWSPYQLAIFDWVENGTGSAVIEAVAGSGKTTTAVEIARRVLGVQRPNGSANPFKIDLGGNSNPSNVRMLFLAFNRDIANTLASQLPAGVECSTLNACGNRFTRRVVGYRDLKVNRHRTSRLFRAITDSYYERNTYGAFVSRLIALAKADAIGVDDYTADNADELRRGVPVRHDADDSKLRNTLEMLVDRHQLTPNIVRGQPVPSIERGIELAIQTWHAWHAENLTEPQDIDFDDQLYLAVAFRAINVKYDVIVVDEAQDVNLIQRRMLHMLLRDGGRLIAVGDPYQSIYGFRGADSDSIDNIVSEFNCVTLPLSVTYRCARNIVTEARMYVDHIEACDTAPDGVVQTLYDCSIHDFNDSDVVLCRFNAPLITLMYTLWSNGIRANYAGKDFTTALITVIKKVGVTDITKFSDGLDAWVANELIKAGDDDNKISRIHDQADSIRAVMTAMSPASVDMLIQRIADLGNHDDNGHILTLSTIHKAKGKQWPRVYILEPGKLMSPYARQPWAIQQESNAAYVAITRAQTELYYVNLDVLVHNDD